jgi:Uma2 family endonuclease
VTALSKLSLSIDNDSRHLRTQATLVCGDRHAPIPDALVLRGGVRDYTDRLPTASDAWCVIEVAGSSYDRDAGEKLVGYARAGVREYVIVNLINRTAELYTNPDPVAGTYGPPQVVTESQSLSLRVGESERFAFRLSEILP